MHSQGSGVLTNEWHSLQKHWHMSNYQSYNISTYKKILDRNSKINQKGDLVAFRPEEPSRVETLLLWHVISTFSLPLLKYYSSSFSLSISFSFSSIYLRYIPPLISRNITHHTHTLTYTHSHTHSTHTHTHTLHTHAPYTHTHTLHTRTHTHTTHTPHTHAPCTPNTHTHTHKLRDVIHIMCASPIHNPLT